MIIATTASLRYFNYTFLRTDVRNLWMGLCICAMGWSTETGNEEMGKWEKEEILHALLPGRVSNYRYVWSDFFLFLLTISPMQNMAGSIVRLGTCVMGQRLGLVI